MRGSRILFFAALAVAAAALFDLAASAAGFTLRRTTTPSTPAASSTASDPSTSTSTTTTSGPALSLGGSPTGTSAPAQFAATREDVDFALFALAAGGHTLAGPAAFFSSIDDDTNVYQVVTGAAVDVCITVRNLARGQIRVSATGAPSVDVDAGETLAACYAAPPVINLACREGAACAGVWRVDRQ